MVRAARDERFGLGKGRPRPPYKPLAIHCPNCGAGLELKNEATTFVVCDYCDSHLELSRSELKVIGKGPDRKWNFPFRLGDRYRHKGVEYEIIARMAFIEDNDPAYTTREYLLFHPAHGNLWLDEYEGHYTLSWPSHLFPKAHPFTQKRGNVLGTHDGRSWVCEETGVYQLAYVDGALLWQAQIGDEINYAEFSEKNGSGLLYDAQYQNGELEYSFGQKLSIEMVQRATGRADLTAPKETMDAAQTRKWYMILFALCILFVAVNGIGAMVAAGKGARVLQEQIDKDRLTDETLTQPFAVAQDGNVIEVRLGSDISNAWMAVNLALVEGEEKAVHVFDEDLEYYHGVEGGESWSEGSRSKSVYIKVPKAGQYRLLVGARSAMGEETQAEQARHNLNVAVTDGALVPHFLIFSSIVSILCLVLTGVSYKKWKDDEDD